MEEKMMSEKVLIKGYQPTVPAQAGKGQHPPVSTPAAMVNVVPPKGGTGEVTIKK